MRPVKEDVKAAIKEAYKLRGRLVESLDLPDEDVDEIATVVLQTTLVIFNALRRVNSTPPEAKNVMNVANDIVSDAIARRTRRQHCSKVSWCAW